MDRFFRRIKNRRGFTIIELIVVIAIIGVLIAMIVPSLNYNGKPQTGKAMAKAFYYEVQDVMTSLKITSADTVKSLCKSGPAGGGAGSTSKLFVVYAEIANDGTVVSSGEIDRVTATASDKFATFDNLISATSSEDEKIVYRKLREAMSAYTTSTDNMAGRLYAMIDEDCVVRGAYWGDAPADELSAYTANTAFEDDCTISGGYYCCAFPVELCTLAGNTPALFIY